MTRRKFLIVDDSFTSRRLLGQILRANFSCKIIDAKEGSEGLQLMISESPDLVFLDMMMPFMNGVQVLQTMRKNTKLAMIPVIACTAVDDDSIVKKIIEMGASHYLVKPATATIVKEKVSQILSS